MSQIITNAFSRYWQECLATQVPVVLDEFVLANVPDLDPDAAINPDSGLPPAGQIVHRHAVDQRGRINNDAVAYTIVMDTTVGDFSFNAMYLINKTTGVVGMIVHKGLETKLKTNEATGQTGNSLVKSMLMEYDRASEATVTQVDASTWQIDYAARLRGMDDDLRLQALQFFGPATFYGNGFNLVNESGVYKVQPGVAYVGGLRAELNEIKKVTPGAKPVGLWLDIYRAGSLLDAWVNHFSLTLSVPDMVDYLDSNGHMHHVAKVAIINADGSVTDVRRKRTIELTGDVAGKGILEDAQGVCIAVEIKDGSHRHQWGEIDKVPATASRWPTYSEVTDKPTLEQMGGYPKTGGPLDGGVDAKDTIYARAGLIARSRGGSNGGTWLGLEAPEDADPYISAKVNAENAPSKVIGIGRSEITFYKRFTTNSMRISDNAGLKFSPNADLSGVSWGLGMDSSNGYYGFHRYLDGTWKDAPMQFPASGGVTVSGPMVVAKGYARIESSSHNILELSQPDHSSSLIYKPVNQQSIRFARGNGSAGDIHGYGEVDGDGFRTLSGRFRANYQAANRAWTAMGQCPFWLEPQPVGGNGTLHGLMGTQFVYPGYWAVEMYHGVFNNDTNAGNLAHVFVGTDGGNFTKIWQLSNAGQLLSPGGWRIEPNGDLFSPRLGGTNVVDWVVGNFAGKNAASGNADIVAGGWGQVGTYMFAALVNGVGQPGLSGVIAGGYLRPSGGGEWSYDNGIALPGTWKQLGSLLNMNGDDRWDDRSTLFIRIA